MIASIIALLASQLAAAHAARDIGVFTSDDVPGYILDSGGIYRVGTQTLIDASGKIIGCRTEQPSAEPRLDSLTCAIILKRAKFDAPAHWTDGSSVPSLHRMTTTYAVNEGPAVKHGDIELTVDQLPRGAGSQLSLDVIFAADERGQISDCKEGYFTNVSRSKSAYPELVMIACEQVSKSWRAFTVLDAAGKPTKSVQNATVVFKRSATSKR